MPETAESLPEEGHEAGEEITAEEINAAIEGISLEESKEQFSKSVESEESEAEESEDSAEEGEEPASESEPESEPELPPIDPPRSWDRKAKEQFKSFPREAQEIIAARQRDIDSDYLRKTEALADTQKRYEGLDRVLKPHMPSLSERGIEPATLVQQALAVDARLRSNPVEGIRWLCQNLHVDPRQLLQVTPPGQNGTPQLPAYSPELAALQNKITQLEQGIKSGKEAERHRVVSESQRVIDAFIEEEDESGESMHPFYQELEDEMIPIVARLRQEEPQFSQYELLKEAYERAQWANPKIRKELLERQQVTQKEEKARKAEEAIEKSRTISGSPGGELRADVPDSAADTLRLVMEGKLK